MSVFDPAVFDPAVFDAGAAPPPPGVSIDAGGMLIGRTRARGGGGATVGPDMRALRPIIAEIEALLREPPQPKKGRIKPRPVELAPEQAADLADRLEAVAPTGPASQLADRLMLIRARRALAAADLELVARALDQLRALLILADDEDAFLMVMT